MSECDSNSTKYGQFVMRVVDENNIDGSSFAKPAPKGVFPTIFYIFVNLFQK